MHASYSRSIGRILILLAFAVSNAAAFVPTQVSYQGRLTDGSGLPLTDTVSVKFSIYNSSGGGIALWTETQPAVPVIDGIFHVLLGSVTPLSEAVFDVNTIPDRFLGVAVGGAPDLQPLQRFVAVPYAFRVETIDDATGGRIVSPVSIGEDNQLTNGVFVAGYSNQATGAQSVAVGGSGNIASGSVASVFGGSDNEASGDHATVSGEGNVAGGMWSVVSGGSNNTADTTGATVGGGENNLAGQSNTVIAGGTSNQALGDRAAVLGGYSNRAVGDWSVVGAGVRNEASGYMAAVLGGNENKATGEFSFVGGGGGSFDFGGAESDSNIASGDYSAVVGGFAQIASGEGAFIGGGSNNIATGLYATVPGGNFNQVTGDYGFAAGRRAKSNHAGSFVWADSENLNFASTANNQFLVRATGGVGIGTNAPQAPLHVQEGSAGTAAHASSVAVFERKDITYVSVLSPSTTERGFLFGDENLVYDGGIIYGNTAMRRGFQIRTGGNQTRMVIDSIGNIGVNDLAPSSRLEIGGPIATKVNVLTAGTTLDHTHSVVILEMPQITGAHLVFLPLASTCPGRVYTFKVSLNNSDDILIQRQGGDLIDNLAAYPLSADFDFLQVVSDGVSRWYVISERP